MDGSAGDAPEPQRAVKRPLPGKGGGMGRPGDGSRAKPKGGTVARLRSSNVEREARSGDAKRQAPLQRMAF